MMKFVIIQCVKAYHSELEQIFKSIEVDAYSEMDIEGFMRKNKGETELSNWFGSTRKPYDYMVSFTFMAGDKAEELLQRIDKFNKNIEEISPVNAYILSVDKFI
jgi:hypothetical protein